MSNQVTRKEAIIGGLSLIIGFLIPMVPSSFNVSDFLNVEYSEYDSDDNLLSFHNQIKSDRTKLLSIATCTLLSLPLHIIHIVCIKRVFEQILSFVDTGGHLKWAYIFLYSFAILISFCLESAMIITVAYYDWEFLDTNGNESYTGYYIQFLLIVLTEQMDQICAYCFGFASICPWILMIKGFLTDRHIIEKQNLMKQLICCKIPIKCCNIILITTVFFSIFIIYIATFSFAKTGFWALEGGSTELTFVIMLSLFSIGGWMVYLGMKMESIQTLLKDITKTQTNVECNP